MQQSHLLTILLTSVAVAGCASDGDTGSSTRVQGSAVYRDAATDHTGAQQAPAAPPAQSASMSIVVKGTGQIPQVDPACALDPAGQFEAHYASTLDLGSDHAYAATMGSLAGAITTPSGCAIPDLSAGVVTDVVIRADLEATTQNCQSFCQAQARADAEAQCGATASSAECRASAEASGAASCQTTCTTQSRAIRAEVSLGAAAVGEVDADALRAAALGELHADLVFDELVAE